MESFDKKDNDELGCINCGWNVNCAISSRHINLGEMKKRRLPKCPVWKKIEDHDNFGAKQMQIREHVLELVNKYPSLKSDYRKLVHFYWFYVNGLNQFIEYKVLERLTQPESITRALRKLVEQGIVDLPEGTKKGRRRQRENYRKFYGTDKK